VHKFIVLVSAALTLPTAALVRISGAMSWPE
jgi:hypothetical protein